MKTHASRTKTALICAAVLAAAAAASFISMNYFDRHIFDNYKPFLLCFGATAAMMLAAAFLRFPLITLLLGAAAAAGIWFYAPAFSALFLPVVLQSVLYDAAKNQRRGDAAARFGALACEAAALLLWFFCKKQDDARLPSYANDGAVAEKIAYLLFSFLLLSFYVFLFFRSRKETKAPPTAKKGAGNKAAGRSRARQKTKKKNAAPAASRVPLYLICAGNTAAQTLYGVLFFNTEYCKVLFFTQMLFLLFLEYREEPLLRAHAAIGNILDAALSPEADTGAVQE